MFTKRAKERIKKVLEPFPFDLETFRETRPLTYTELKKHIEDLTKAFMRDIGEEENLKLYLSRKSGAEPSNQEKIEDALKKAKMVLEMISFRWLDSFLARNGFAEDQDGSVLAGLIIFIDEEVKLIDFKNSDGFYPERFFDCIERMQSKKISVREGVRDLQRQGLIFEMDKSQEIFSRRLHSRAEEEAKNLCRGVARKIFCHSLFNRFSVISSNHNNKREIEVEAPFAEELGVQKDNKGVFVEFFPRSQRKLLIELEDRRGEVWSWQFLLAKKIKKEPSSYSFHCKIDSRGYFFDRHILGSVASKKTLGLMSKGAKIGLGHLNQEALKTARSVCNFPAYSDYLNAKWLLSRKASQQQVVLILALLSNANEYERQKTDGDKGRIEQEFDLLERMKRAGSAPSLVLGKDNEPLSQSYQWMMAFLEKPSKDFKEGESLTISELEDFARKILAQFGFSNGTIKRVLQCSPRSAFIYLDYAFTHNIRGAEIYSKPGRFVIGGLVERILDREKKRTGKDALVIGHRQERLKFFGTLCRKVLQERGDEQGGETTLVQSRRVIGINNAVSNLYDFYLKATKEEIKEYKKDPKKYYCNIGAEGTFEKKKRKGERIDIPQTLYSHSMSDAIDYLDYLKAEKFSDEEFLKNPTLLMNPSKVKQELEQWHLRLTLERRKANRGEPKKWESLIKEFTTEKSPLVAIALDNEEELEKESIIMHHCVADYTYYCVKGECRIFSIQEKETGKRLSTLEIGFDFYGMPTVVEQHRGKHNAAVKEDLLQFGEEVLAAYREQSSKVERDVIPF